MSKIISRRDFLVATGVAGAGLMLYGCGVKDSNVTPTPDTPKEDPFPEKDITLIVPWAPGSTSDRNARALKPFMDKHLKRSLLVENIAGASGLGGWTAFMKDRPADGYSFTFTNWPVLYQQIVTGTTDYTLDKFYHLGGINDDPITILKRKDDNRWANAAELFDDIKKNPDKISFAMTGPNSFQNLVAYYLMDQFDMKFRLVNSPGGASEANQMLAGGHVDICLTNCYSGFLIREVATSLGLMAESTAPNMWPEATSIAKQTGRADLATLTVLRGFATHSETYEKYPERVKYIQDILDKAGADPEFKKVLMDSGESDVAYWMPRDEFVSKLKGSLEVVDQYKKYLV